MSDIVSMKGRMWDILPRLGCALMEALSVAPTYNARLSKMMGIRPYPKNRGGGGFFVWTFLRDERTSPGLSVGALPSSDVGFSPKNVVLEDADDSLSSYSEEVLERSWRVVQECLRDIGRLIVSYVRSYPEKAYCASFVRDMDVDLYEGDTQHSGEFIDYVVKALLAQEILGYTGEKGPRGSHLLTVLSGKDYEIQPAISVGKSRCGSSYGEAMAFEALSVCFPGSDIVHQKKWKGCRDKKELPFDFFDEGLGIVWEIDGAQHFRPVDFFGGEDSFRRGKEHDVIKNRFCVDEGLKLVRIDSTTRDVARCVRDACSRVDSLDPVTLYGDNYGVGWVEDMLGSETVVSFDSWGV